MNRHDEHRRDETEGYLEDHLLIEQIVKVVSLNPKAKFARDTLAAHLGVPDVDPRQLQDVVERLPTLWPGDYLDVDVVSKDFQLSVREKMFPLLLTRLANILGHHGCGLDTLLRGAVTSPCAPIEAPPVYIDEAAQKKRDFLALTTNSGETSVWRVAVFTHPLHLVLVRHRPGAAGDPRLEVARALYKYQVALSVAHRFGDYFSLIVAPSISRWLHEESEPFSAALLTESEYSAFLTCRAINTPGSGPSIHDWVELLRGSGPRWSAVLSLVERVERG